MKREPGYVPTTLEMFMSIARRTLLAYLVLAVVGAGAAAIVAGSGAVWGVLLGIGLAGGAMGLTLLVMMVTEKVGGVNDMAIMLGSYLLKMVVLFVVFVAFGRERLGESCAFVCCSQQLGEQLFEVTFAHHEPLF